MNWRLACPSSTTINQKNPEEEGIRVTLGPRYRRCILTLRQMSDHQEEDALATEGVALAGGEPRETAELDLQSPIVPSPRDSKAKEVVQELRLSLDEVEEGVNKTLPIRDVQGAELLLTVVDRLIMLLFHRTPRGRKMQQLRLPVLEKDRILPATI